MNEKKEKTSIGIMIQELPDYISKGAIILLFSVLGIVMFLFMPFVIRTEITFEIAISGFKFLQIMASGGQFGYAFGGAVYKFVLPQFMSVLYCISLALIVCSVVMSVVIYFVRKKESKTLGWLYILLGVFYLIMFMFFVFFNQTTTNIYEEEVPVYQAYSPGNSILVCALLFICAGLIQIGLKLERLRKVKKFWFIYLMLIPGAIYVAIFEIYPLFLQIVMAFKDYRLDRGIWGSEWVGIQNFYRIFSDPTVYSAILNTFYYSLMLMITGLLPSLIFALMLYEIKSDIVRKSIQTISYIPHFFSWVIMYAIASALLGSTGVVNGILVEKLGLERVDFFSTPSLFVPLILISDLWKGLGWGTIIFLAALSGVSPELYDAAAVDGAGPMHRTFHITLPAIMPVFLFLLIMRIGHLLGGASREQLLLFSTAVTKKQATVIGTWLYWEGLGGLEYGLGSAMSFFQSVVGLIMVLSTNYLSKRVVGRSII